jgi:[methyl-Co(III) methanol-specific corrinoid protein]:coenzyme M methyltransferase
MNSRDRVLNALTGKSVDRIPVTAVTQTGTVEFMKETGAMWPEAHSNPESAVKLALAAYELAGLETARIPFSLTVLAEALGSEIDSGKIDRQPSVKSHPYSNGMSEFKIPENLLELKLIPAMLEATRLLKEEVGDKLPIIVGFEGPATLAGHLMGIERMAIWTLKKPEKVKEALEATIEVNLRYAEALLKAGADVLVPCEPSVSPDIFHPKNFEGMFKPFLTSLAEEIRCVKVLHICGNVTPILRHMAETGYNALSIEEKVNMEEAKKIVDNLATIVGNISTAKTLLSGSPQTVKEESIKAIKGGVDALAPGCGIAPDTPTSNLKAMVEAVHE